MIRRAVHLTYRTARRIAVLAVGSTVVLLGIVMLVTPGPGLLVIPVGLAILSVEFAWARLWLRKLREGISNQASKNHAARAERHRDRTQGPG
jgi:tellurite resistance protein TerC